MRFRAGLQPKHALLVVAIVIIVTSTFLLMRGSGDTGLDLDVDAAVDVFEEDVSDGELPFEDSVSVRISSSTPSEEQSKVEGDSAKLSALSGLHEMQNAVLDCFDFDILQFKLTPGCASLLNDLRATGLESNDPEALKFALNALSTEISSYEIEDMIVQFLRRNPGVDELIALDLYMSAVGFESHTPMVESMYEKFFQLTDAERNSRLRDLVAVSTVAMENPDVRSSLGGKARDVLSLIKRKKSFVNVYSAAGLSDDSVRYLEQASPEETARWMEENSEEWRAVEENIINSENGYVSPLEEYDLERVLSGGEDSASSVVEYASAKNDPYFVVELFEELKGACPNPESDEWCRSILSDSSLTGILAKASESEIYDSADRSVFSEYLI